MSDTDSRSQTVSTTLLQRLRGGEDEAYVRLQHLFSDTVARRLRRMGIPEREIDDLRQEVFLKIWKAIDDFRRDLPESSFRRWLHTITRNVAFDYFSEPKADRLGTDLLGQVPDALDADEAAAERAGEVHRMLEIVRGDFSETTYQIFLRYWLHGHDTDELAREYGMKKNSVREARHRVMRRLRETFLDLYGESEWPFARQPQDCGGNSA